jgi:hypothetical protein
MKNNLLLGLLFAALSLFGRGSGQNRHGYQATIEQRAVLDLLLERHEELSRNSVLMNTPERAETKAALNTMTKGIQGIGFDNKIEHLRKHGLSPYRVALLNVIKSTFVK